MDFEGVTRYILEQFAKNQVRYCLIGGFALHAAGFSRATRDIDFLVHHEDTVKIKAILTGFGYDITHNKS